MTSTADPGRSNIPRDETAPTFDARWQAQAFALVERLSETGHFGWNEWVRVFSREVACSPSSAWESENDTYYR